ncbi:MAG: HDOD domain-containing protein, partial [Desulfovibrionales bacterium]|nr:HDOD domain-containing protein [Desulfovibrionales bacterium]
MDKKRLFEKISQPGQLPPLPQVMLNLIRVCDDGQSHVDAVIDIISTDPGLTSQLLQLLGSSYVNLPGGVVSLKNAVVYLGMDTVRNLAISSSAMHFFSKTFSLPNFHMEDFWYRSYRAAVLARNLACEVQLPEAEGFFLAGLLHGVGSLVLMRNFPQKYKGILKENFSRTQVARAEGRIFGVDG